jgi:hypothetical protein
VRRSSAPESPEVERLEWQVVDEDLVMMATELKQPRLFAEIFRLQAADSSAQC